MKRTILPAFYFEEIFKKYNDWQVVTTTTNLLGHFSKKADLILFPYQNRVEVYFLMGKSIRNYFDYYAQNE